MIINSVRRAKRSYCGHGGAIRSAGEVRASAPIRALVAVIAALLAVQFMPVAAYADGINAQIISGPSAVPFADMYGASLAAPDRYTAAALLLGYSPETISSWDDDTRAKLSNEQTGGQFYYFAENSVQNYFDATEHTGIFKTFLDYVGGTFWNIAQSLYGNNLWAALYTSEELAAAASDLSSILDGGNIGGGGSGGGDTETGTFHLQFTDSGVTLKFNRYYLYQNTVYYPNALDVGGNTTSRSVPDVVYKLTNSNVLTLLQDTTLKVYIWGSDSFSGGGNGSTNLSVMITDDDPVVTTREITYNNQTWTTQVYTWTYHAGKRYYYRNSGSVTSGDGFIYTSSDIPANNSFTTITANLPPTGNGTNVPYYMGAAGGGGDPVVPPTNWPDEPSAPSPPELPEPGTNPTVTPAPWSPVLNPTFDFDLNITTDPTSSDLIDWVQKIYFELKAFHRDAHDWANDFGGGFTKVVQAVNSASSQLYSQLLVIDSSIHDEGLRIRNYMYQMFHWLKDQLDFQNNSFDDNNIVYWLKRIWSKLGSGDINLRPTDPTTEPENWWDWLVKAIQNFLIGLAATSSELISEIADIASQVMHEFPFSIPWDIAAILAALATSPITPKFTFVIPAVEGWWSDVQFVIDLSPFDTAAETIRLMEKLLFTGFLIWKSKDLLDFMDVTKWFN